MCDKPKVYQGVRVKATVRELLQKRRALQANRMATIPQSLPSQEVCSMSSPALTSENLTTANNYQHCIDNVNNYPTEVYDIDDLQLLNAIIQTEDFTNSSLHPTPVSHLPSPENLQSNTEDNCQNWASCSNSESPNFPGPVDSYAYSPQDHDSSSSLYYNYPTQTNSSQELCHWNIQCHSYSLQQSSTGTLLWPDSAESGLSFEYGFCGMPDWWNMTTADQSYLRETVTSPEIYMSFHAQTGLF